ncbi:3-isopropylmalate dehydratase large subunit [Desulfofustis limnaeus]|jgi:3-isopropylmalate/(R)-2-methylmalate dehydratase large subunit|uniref:3-isopropylmalate dehydratase large subunit n=1 Tax=Desulfofustis limnaeus TaxID=2740163 RepID=A0ABN6M7E3_9BACT|nr:3-isopropylmalate dehydratase large subunit [Desulfofustis limnaeus]MDX9894275.1 3-isopropylmalate dehydratase large subunit [Desulfofustis sp.]BDD88803.1 3-isopropylmalate dehydratase large subunit [Desulfofustis limnaeus]
MGRTLFTKVWDAHRVAALSVTRDQLFIALHLVHEVTSPQAFQALRERGLAVKYPQRTIATVDHIVPTLQQQIRPYDDSLAEEMLQALETNTREFGVRFLGLGSDHQGIVHIIGPENGLTQPGMTIACGDSHTSTHGALGAIAFGIGTSQVRDVLATQTLALERLKVRRIDVVGQRSPGVYAKDIVLRIIGTLGVKGGIGYAYEYGGPAIEDLSMEERMTVCNMSIEGGARIGYVNPDQTTFDYLRGRPFVPTGEAFDRAVHAWRDMASDTDAVYDDRVTIAIEGMAPQVTWGINPGQVVGIDQPLPQPDELPAEEREGALQAYRHMGFEPGRKLLGEPVDVAFIGSCTNGRLSDFRAAAEVLRGRRVAAGVRALAVPGSRRVKRQAEQEGLDRVFHDAGFAWREPGCSLCLAMNPDKLAGRQLCASSSNRNFIGRQGAPHGRTLLMSPAMVAAAAVSGSVADVRDFLRGERHD